MALKVGFKLLFFLQLVSFGFVDSLYECAFNGKEFVTFGRDTIDGPMPCKYTLLATNGHGHIDSFQIEVICNHPPKNYERSIDITALGKKIRLNMYDVTIDKIPQKRDVSINIPPLRIDVAIKRGTQSVRINTGITVLYTPPNAVKIVILNNYTGTHNLTGACGNPWVTTGGLVNRNASRHRLFKRIKGNPKYRTKQASPHLARVKPQFEMVTSVYGYPNRHSSQSQQRNGAHNPQSNSNKADDWRFQKDKLYSRCYFEGFLHVNGSIWMSVDCLIVFTCVNSYVVHGKSSGCSEFGDCVKGRQGGTCRCRPGFTGNGLTCAFMQNNIAPPKYRPGHAPHNDFATMITPTVPADRLVTTVGVNVKRRPTHPDWGNRRRQPLHNHPWGRQHRNNVIKKNDNKRWRPSKRRPLLNANKPGRQSPSVHSEFSEVGRDPMAKDNDNPKLVKNRPGFKKVPSKTDRTHPSKPRIKQQTKPKIFTHLNKPNRDRQIGKKLVKPLMKDNKPQFMGNRGHPRTSFNSRVIPDTLPQNNLDSYPGRIKNKHGHIYISCKRKNGRRICKLIREMYENDKTVPNADAFNPGLGKRRIIPINNNFRPHKKIETNPVVSPNNDKDLMHLLGDIMRMHRYHNNTHNKGDPTSRALANAKRNDPRSNRPNKKDHKTPHLNQRRYKRPIQSDMKRVTEILQRMPVALNETDNNKVTVSRWDILPLSSTLFTSPTTGKYTFLDSTATFTPTTIGFINPSSKKTEDSRFSYSPRTSTSEIRHVRTLSTMYTSLEQPRPGPNWRPLSNDDGGFPGRKGDTVKNNARQNPGGNVKHRYPTADGTIDGLVIDPPSKWPLSRPGAKPGYGNQNIPINKKQFPKYVNKGKNRQTQHRPSKNGHQPNRGPKLNSINRKCRWIGCMRRNNATNKGQTFLHVLYSSTTGSSNTNDQVLTLATTVGQTIAPEIKTDSIKNNQTVKSKPQKSIINPNTPDEKPKPQPPSIAEVPANSDDQSKKCEETKTKNPLSGLRYKLLKQVRHSVEEIGR